MISPAFITYAANVLGHTETGLSGSKIVEYCVDYAVQYGKDIPHSTYPFSKGTPNKRTALAENLRCFEPEQQFFIIKKLCQLPLFKDNSEVIGLQIRLISQDSQYSKQQEDITFLMEDVEHWLNKYPDVYKHYKLALEKRKLNRYSRNVLDDLRFALEKLLNNILNNQNTLENQIKDLGLFLKNKEINPELRNLFHTIIFDRLCKYQNNHVKHNDTFEELEVDFVIEQTLLVMKFLVKFQAA